MLCAVDADEWRACSPGDVQPAPGKPGQNLVQCSASMPAHILQLTAICKACLVHQQLCKRLWTCPHSVAELGRHHLHKSTSATQPCAVQKSRPGLSDWTKDMGRCS